MGKVEEMSYEHCEQGTKSLRCKLGKIIALKKLTKENTFQADIH